MNPIPWRPHAPWVMLSFVSLFFLTAIGPLAARLNNALQAQQTALTARKERLTLHIEQWKADTQTAQTLSQSLSKDEVDRLLAPHNRAFMTAQLEPLAAAARLAHMNYILAPAIKWMGETTFLNIQGITKSALTLEADAPHDGDIFTFLESLSALEGKIKLESLNVSHLNSVAEDNRPKPPVTALNLHMKAAFSWYANEERGKD